MTTTRLTDSQLQAIKPLDLSNLLKFAFLSGRRVSSDDAWVRFDPTVNPAYQRITAALAELQERRACDSAIVEACAKLIEGDARSFDYQEALAECRDGDAAYNRARLDAAAMIRALAPPAPAVTLTREQVARDILDKLNAVAPAVEQLASHQVQADTDGVMVKVPRQALDEVLEAVNSVAVTCALPKLDAILAAQRGETVTRPNRGTGSSAPEVGGTK